MNQNEKYTASDVALALTETKGMVTLAARRLGCSINTVKRYIRNYPTVAQAQTDARAAMTDAVELKLYDNIMKGDTTAAIFYLKTQGRDRGYIDKIDINLKGRIEVALVNRLLDTLEAQGLDASEVFNELIQQVADSATVSSAGDSSG